jgi:DNA-binding winged helix-turn-helix (wHTH) protein/Tol biopolymer transport system component
MQRRAKHFYAFGPFRLDSRERILRRDGQPVALTPKAVDILFALVQNSEHLVDKDELMRQVWLDSFVEESNLTKNISVLRKTLGATEDGREYIETVARRGYRFAATVQAWSEEEEQVIQEFPRRAPVPQPPKVERIDRGRGHALAREPEPIRETPSQAAPTSPVPAAAAALSRQEAREADARGLKPRQRRRLTLGVTAGLTAVVAFAIWGLLPPPAPKVLRTLQVTHSGRVEELSRLVTDGARLFLMERRGGRDSVAQVSNAGGETVPLTTPFPNTELLDISPDHSALLVSSVGAGEEEGQLWALPTLGGPPRRLGSVSAQDAAWSPDGRKILYATGSNLYLMNADGSESEKLASTVGFPHYPRWSPDGRVVRFTLGDLPAHTESLWEITPEGRNLHRLLIGWRESPTDWGDGESGGDWTSDGKYFVFRSVRAHTASIWALREKGSFLRWHSRGPTLLTTSDLYLWTTSVAGNGTRILFGGGKEERELQRYDSRLSQFVPYLSGVPARWASFSKDGRWVAYVTTPGFALWRSRLDGGDRLQLTFPPAGSGIPRWSPDGKRIAVVTESGICVVPADGGTPEEVASGEDPDWSPDGGTLLFSTHDSSRVSAVWALQRLELKTRQMSQWPASEGLRESV